MQADVIPPDQGAQNSCTPRRNRVIESNEAVFHRARRCHASTDDRRARLSSGCVRTLPGTSPGVGCFTHEAVEGAREVRLVAHAAPNGD
jgi:hypothetical protein